MVSPLYLSIARRHVIYLQGKVFISKTKIFPIQFVDLVVSMSSPCKLCQLFDKWQNCPITYYFRQLSHILHVSRSFKGNFLFLWNSLDLFTALNMILLQQIMFLHTEQMPQRMRAQSCCFFPQLTMGGEFSYSNELPFNDDSLGSMTKKKYDKNHDL